MIKTKEEKRKYMQNWRKNHKEQTKEYKRQYRAKNKDKINKYLSNYIKNRQKNDVLFRLRTKMTSAINNSLYYFNNYKQNKSWEKLLGYNREQLKAHLEKQFINGMSWENQSSYWEIEHKIPLSWFDNEEELLKIGWNLNNIQPLEKKQNQEKSNKYALVGKSVIHNKEEAVALFKIFY
jgi:hypothetical protein